MDESQRGFVYVNPELVHTVSWNIEDEYDSPVAIIRFTDGDGSAVYFPFDSNEELENFKYLIQCFVENAGTLFEEYENEVN